MSYRFRIIAIFVLCSLFLLPGRAEKWTTHLAYNNVTQIAMAEDKVYALSDGSLFSVDKQSEAIKVYNRQSGLHETTIACIYYDRSGKQLIIAYGNGKIDLLSSRGVQYIGELYDKDMTQRKTIYNVTIAGRTAYLATHYGIQTMDLRENKLVDSYWLRPGGQETPIKDVLIANDSIYAFSDDSLYCAALTDPLSDYTYWHRELLGRIPSDTEKGVHYQDGTSDWYRGYGEGIIRFTATERLTYKPDGPLTNTPYCMRAIGNRLGVIQGGNNISSYKRPGMVMIFENGQWHNYDHTYMENHIGMASRDYTDILFDPNDKSHFFVSSFGYGLMEFRADTFFHHYNTSNSGLEAIIEPVYPYTWVDGLQWDAEGNLWMTNISDHSIKALQPDGNWLLFTNDACKDMGRSKDILISPSNPNIKFISSIRDGVGVWDNNGTLNDQSDDRAVLCTSFQDQNGNALTIARTSSFFLTPSGKLLIGTEAGLYRIDQPETLLNNNLLCEPVVVSIPEEGREHIFEAENIRSIAKNHLSQIWVGTQYTGLYLLSEDLTQVLAHYTTDTSPMPSNDVLSICQMDNQHLFIGTSEGLVEYDPNGSGEGLNGSEDNETSRLEEGSMLNWKLHFSYVDPLEMAATPSAIYAVGNGSLFCVNRSDESISYWNKSTGLSGSSIAHIAYDTKASKLIIAYENGQVDLLDDNGTVTSMSDISLKAGSMAVTVNAICPGSDYCYLAMPFGIIALQTRKAEVSETYYIGTDAASIDVQHVVEMGDSLYAFSFDKIYHAALKDNKMDYSYWHSELMPFEQVQQATVYNGQMVVLAHDSLYRRVGTSWQLESGQPLQWMHASGNQLLGYAEGKGLLRLMDDDSWSGLSANYVANDALYTNGEYWLAEANYGLIRLGSNGDDYFHTAGPNSNFGYRMYAMHNRIYAMAGGRWAGQFVRPGRINIYDGSSWRGIDEGQIGSAVGVTAYDISSLGIDPQDPGHFFAASYGRGVYEFKNYTAVKRFTTSNSTIREATEGINPELYTFVDGATMDAEGNLWILNATTVGRPLHIYTPNGQWIGLPLRSGGTNHNMTTPTGIWIDQRNSQYKWMLCQRAEPRVILLNDGGTPTISSDDRCMIRNSFTDQNGNVLTPAQFRCLAQDQNDRIWIGTDKGIILIPKDVDFFTSNACQRIIIPRNDGTGLGDYLLGDEQITCLAVDGGNRMWIGTANSGLYLIEDDTITVAHFTETNSLLPANGIQSIAIMPGTGEVFVGTDKGIASYLSDASEPKEDMSGAYAYPNPVRPDYVGYISITGLMDNTVVNIVDAGGNLVCKTRSHGGTAVWDGKDAYGKRATPGVYTAMCNANGGQTVVKILIAR